MRPQIRNDNDQTEEGTLERPEGREKRGAKAVHQDTVARDDLLVCLSYMCSEFGCAKSPSALVAGLAYYDQAMTPDLFCEAATRQNIKTAIVDKGLSEIPEEVLPCILFLKNNAVCILLSRDKKYAKIFNPAQMKIETLEREGLQQKCAGRAIFMKPERETIESYQGAGDKNSAAWFWSLIRENKSIYSLAIIASIFINLFALVSPLFIMNVYDRVIPNNAIETGWALGIGALIAFAFDFTFRTLRGYFIDFSNRKIDILAARRIYDHLLDMKIAGKPGSSGGFASILKDFDAVREFFNSATITAVVDLPFTLLFLFFVYQLGGSIAFLLLVLIIIACVAGLTIQAVLKTLVIKSKKTAQMRHGILVETIGALETIKTTAADGAFRTKYSTSVAEDAQFAQKSRLLSALSVNIATFIQQTASIIIVLFGMYLVQNNSLTIGALIACVILGSRAIAPIGQVAGLITKYHQASAALAALNIFMGAQSERPKTQNFLNRAKLSGKITFDTVSFSYPNADIPVLRNVSFTIHKGEKVGIIGRIGSGKSTVLKLCLKLYDPGEGVILFDDTDIRQIDPADVRTNTAYIAQDVKLFQGTVRENICISRPHSSEESILEAAKKAGVDEFIARHPMGYDAPVGELGAHLSGGQRQAIAVARAMLAKPNILICDEPTNAMDTQAEAAFCQYVAEQMQGKTLIMVTHKNAMLALVDRLILLHEGRVVMDAPRDQVIEALKSGNITETQKTKSHNKSVGTNE